jgi:serine/threonine-protein kinase
MGEVYRADDMKLGQAVALKFLRGELSASSRERLYAEVRVGRQISHPNVCRLYDVVEVEGQIFIAMEYVDGEDLASLLGRIGHLAPDKALDVARDLCAGLAAAHDRGVIHRDLKPANVMLDGRGRARLTDFGLALAPGEHASADVAGTAPYMAPEQLLGLDVTPRSDLYSLGLIFYEMVSGRRFYTAGSLEELSSQHRASKQPRLSVLSGQVDPAFERLIVQCLADDPQARPVSARALLKSLPGGDPLEAAIAAGETPAPDTLAAAGDVGELSRPVAWAGLLAALGMMAFAVYLVDRGSVIPRVPTPKSPEILVERAREVLVGLGLDAPRADSAFAYDVDYDYFHQVYQERSSDRWDRARKSALSLIFFFYRQSPKVLVAANRNAVVDRTDPPSDVPGMAEVCFDPQGRLTSLVAVPPRAEPGGPWPDPDWSSLFREARLDYSGFHSITPLWTAPVDSDRKAAWEGAYPGTDGMAVRVEAAAYHGRPVWFAVLPPWAVPERPFARAVPQDSVWPFPYRSVLAATLVLALPLGGALLARRNLRRGRGDRRGAFRVALFVFATYSLARLSRADHVSTVGNEFWLLIKVFAYPLCFAALVWLFYMAVEPYARRLWPRILISWGRLVAGRLRDPMVGRDMLFGIACGAYGAALDGPMSLLSSWLGRPQMLPSGVLATSSLTSWNELVFRVFVNQHSAVLWGWGWLLLLVLLRVVLRRNGLALAAWAVLELLLNGLEDPAVDLIGWALIAPVVILLLMRCGLLGFCTSTFVGSLLLEVPYTLDLTAWYAPRGFVVLGLLVALAVYAFRVSLGGKPAFGGAWLEP